MMYNRASSAIGTVFGGYVKVTSNKMPDKMSMKNKNKRCFFFKLLVLGSISEKTPHVPLALVSPQILVTSILVLLDLKLP